MILSLCIKTELGDYKDSDTDCIAIQSNEFITKDTLV